MQVTGRFFEQATIASGGNGLPHCSSDN